MQIDTKNITNPAKLGLNVLAVGAGLYGAYYFATHLSLFLKNRAQKSKYNKEIKGKGTYPPTQYDNWADAIEKAYYPTVFGIGTDEDTILYIFDRLRNNNDFLLLLKAYGVRPYYQGGFEYAKFNLPQSLAFEDDGAEMRNKINTMFKKRGITYRL